MAHEQSNLSRGAVRATARLSTLLVALLLVAPTSALAATPLTASERAPVEDEAPGPVPPPSVPVGGNAGSTIPLCGGLCLAAAVSAAVAAGYGYMQYCADQPNKPSCWWTEDPGDHAGDGGNGGNGGNGGAGCSGLISVSLSGCCPGEGGRGGRGGDGGNGGSGHNSGEPGDGGDAGDEGETGTDGENTGAGLAGCGADALSGPRVHGV